MEKCRTCNWWVRVGDWGQCRKRAPITGVEDKEAGIYKPIWPETMNYHFCSEFEGRTEE